MILRLSTRRKARTQRTPMPETPATGDLHERLAARPGGLRDLACARLRRSVEVALDHAGLQTEKPGRLRVNRLAGMLHDAGYELEVRAVPAGDPRRKALEGGGLAGDLVGRLTAALLAEPWNSWPKAAHGDHRFDSGCAICQGDVDRLAAFVARFHADNATGKESFPVGDLRDRIAAAMIADLRAARPDAAPDEEEDRAAYELTDAVLPVVEAWAAEQTQRAEQAERHLAYRHGEWQRELDARIAAERKLQEAERERDEARAAMADLIRVAAYVSRGRRFVDVEPYPDALARKALGALDDATLHAALDRPDDTPSKPCPLGLTDQARKKDHD